MNVNNIVPRRGYYYKHRQPVTILSNGPTITVILFYKCLSRHSMPLYTERILLINPYNIADKNAVKSQCYVVGMVGERS